MYFIDIKNGYKGYKWLNKISNDIDVIIVLNIDKI